MQFAISLQHRELEHYILYCSENDEFKNGINKSGVHWIDCACLVYKMRGCYNKGVYIQLIRSTTRRYFRGRRHGPAWKCIYPKINLQRNARNHGNVTKRTCELHERAINSKKGSYCHGPFVLEKHIGKALISVEDLRQGWVSYNGPLSKIILPAAPVKIAVTEWPA